MSAYSHGRDFLFCGLCGNLLILDSPHFARCPLCHSKRSISEIEGREVQYTISAEDIKRDLQLEPFLLSGTHHMREEVVQRAVVNETCPKCHHPELQYYTKQLRSADEGQTVFYECSECAHKFSVNT